MSSLTSTRTRILLLVAGVTLLGAALRLWNLGGQSLWLDEAFTARIASLGLAGIVNAIRTDLDTPPLHPFFVHFVLVLGNSDLVLRLPSAIASILSIPLMYVLAKRLLGTMTGLLAALLLALSPFAVYFAQEARMYALVLFFTLLTWYALVRALGNMAAPEESQRGRWWLVFVVSAALGLYTHFFGFLVLGLMALYTGLHLLEQWRAGQNSALWRTTRNFILALAGVAILYLPWSPVLLSFVTENYSARPYGQTWQANLSPDVALNMLTLILGGYWAHPVVRWWTRLLVVLGLIFLARRRPALAVFVALSGILPFAFIGLLNPGHFVTERYFIFILPMLLLSIAEALSALAGLPAALAQRLQGSGKTAWSRRSTAALVAIPVLASFLAVPLLSASGLQLYFAEPPKPAWRQLAHYVTSHVPPGDLIVVATFPHWDSEPLQHYLGVGGRRVVFAAKEPNLRQILQSEQHDPWWIVYAGAERRLGRLMSTAVGNGYTVIPFDFLALLQRQGDNVDGVGDGLAILRSLRPRIPDPYKGEVARVINGLESLGGDMGQPIAPPLPLTPKPEKQPGEQPGGR